MKFQTSERTSEQFEEEMKLIGQGKYKKVLQVYKQEMISIQNLFKFNPRHIFFVTFWVKKMFAIHQTTQNRVLLNLLIL